jgi:Tfp pilus assembly protein PilX
MRIKTVTVNARRLARCEQGYTMFFALMVLFVSALLVTGAFVAVEGDINQTHTSTAQRKAYYAAQAGLQVYLDQLNSSPNFWTTCPHTPETAGKLVPVAVPGTSDETYTYETLPSSTAPGGTCKAGEPATIVESAAVTADGTFRVKATGIAPSVKGPHGEQLSEDRSIVTTFSHSGFLNYVFLSNYEVEDPTTLPGKPVEACKHYYKYRKEHGLTGTCPSFPFIEEDELKGPFHTNDASEISGNPEFGRSKNDEIQMDEGYYGGTPVFVGTYVKGGATLAPPPTDEELLKTAGYKFKGRTVIELEEGSPNTMTGSTYNAKGEKEEFTKRVFPANGVVYVENAETVNGKLGSCTIEYSPFVYDKNYEEEEAKPYCGDVYVKGKYTESLTVGSQHDVIVIGPIETTHESSGKPTGAATLGLIANDFVRVYHPVTGSGTSNKTSCPGATNQTKSTDLRKWGSLPNLVIDAAILSTENSFIVDNFSCGESLKELTVWGAIAQNWRGRVTLGPGGGGYPHKNYNYDERLQTEQPPNFLSPETTGGWKVTRETE